MAYLVMCHHPPDWLFDQDDCRRGQDINQSTYQHDRTP